MATKKKTAKAEAKPEAKPEVPPAGTIRAALARHAALAVIDVTAITLAVTPVVVGGVLRGAGISVNAVGRAIAWCGAKTDLGGRKAFGVAEKIGRAHKRVETAVVVKSAALGQRQLAAAAARRAQRLADRAAQPAAATAPA